MQSDAALIREILARECETVSSYEALAARAADPATRTLILHLAREEKEHIAECARYLARLDAEYAEFLQKPLRHALGEGEAGAAQTSPGAGAAPVPAPAAARRPMAWTIGSLVVRGEAETAP